ncbi:hypothetical protein K2173_000725 [Erythroxylum novogranatense]|uniref:Phosphoglycerate kinase n=1 Tax=Erythroxylum novogranatense TaxID=1862640 RepID=A0AAV8SJ14_9ROSI|nr:hypothetical protein K2173_000725 [Erythroxylum novogranatense]
MAKKSVGEITAADLNERKFKAVIPTIKHLIQNEAEVVLSSHLGRPKGVTPRFSLAPFVPHLSQLLGIQVVKVDDCLGPEVEKLVALLPQRGVLLLDNFIFYKEEEKNEPEFAKKLASLADLYINDAFGTAHRAHASTEISSPKRPFATIVGGSKVSSKIGVIESLLKKCDILLLGGGMIFTFYKDKLNLATSLLEKVNIKGVSLFSKNYPNCYLNGPMGVFKFDKFVVGTEAIAKKLANLIAKGVTTIIGGGDYKMSHISTGGGASLELLEGKELPGVLALDEATLVVV